MKALTFLILILIFNSESFAFYSGKAAELDPVDAHPILSELYGSANLQDELGTPVCTKIR